ncbi:group I intron-associated PD-(D/E)XK endonuclease [Falsiroseomonas sp. HC035]|uniref:group I intron-associated PD-(D/E)XK endonuclease n=1 Tax=Falsiroseomonas sp. HC035 TaxID=3390999 RepID=UPI003D310DA6
MVEMWAKPTQTGHVAEAFFAMVCLRLNISVFSSHFANNFGYDFILDSQNQFFKGLLRVQVRAATSGSVPSYHASMWRISNDKKIPYPEDSCDYIALVHSETSDFWMVPWDEIQQYIDKKNGNLVWLKRGNEPLRSRNSANLDRYHLSIATYKDVEAASTRFKVHFLDIARRRARRLKEAESAAIKAPLDPS